ncbi:cytochrome P450 [Actinocorallia sp. A-T 12471]|uniref:cytochrome P450 n=1 Tax=Actinocorallia sp. A-T 12471 TaxID=3089813 RepID=UPI0029D00C06|nr:cytochrome P450 [Actinocorallia sp. A-T 12471]MDX6741257.1 cytochrome P450 [Actinocorallia sp. A-T 12471]
MDTDGYLAKYDALQQSDPGAALALLAGWLRTDWRPLFAELRARRPVLVTPAFALVTRFADVTEVLSRPGSFTVAAYAPPMEAALGSPNMLTRDATPLNWREKGLMQVMLAPEDVPALRALTGSLADDVLDKAGGSLDVVAELFRAVPLGVCARYFGFPGPDQATLSRWSRAVMTDVTANLPGDPAVRAASVEAGKEMMAYLRALVAERKAGPEGSDVLGRLVRTRLPAELGFDDERVAVNTAALLLGFVENAAGSMTNVLGHLLAHPPLLARAAEAARDPERFEPFVWEALRFDPFLKMIIRYRARDHVLASGAHLPGGGLVLASVASAMFDETAVPAPEEFRLDRPAHAQLHFGHGPHGCLGVHAGRTVIVETLRRLLLRPGLRPGGGVLRDRGVFPDSLPLHLDAPAWKEPRV